jgi:hypothetical protein
MKKRSLRELKLALGNVDGATRKAVHAPKVLSRVDWNDLDYLGWRDPGAQQRGYLFIEREETLHGVMVLNTKTQTAAARAVMCAFCKMPRRFGQVVLFSSPTLTNTKGTSTKGTYICADLDCNARVNGLRPMSPLDPPADELVAKHRSQLSAAAHRFIASVLELPELPEHSEQPAPLAR